MAEMNSNGTPFRAPENNRVDMTQSPVYPGSWQQILHDYEGQYCIIDFLIGTESMVHKEGILYNVGVSFIVLYDPRSGNYVVCDLYSIKFVTFAGTISLPSAKIPRKKV